MRKAPVARGAQISLKALLARAILALSVGGLLLAGTLQFVTVIHTQTDLVSNNLRMAADETAHTVREFIQGKTQVLRTTVWFRDLFAADARDRDLILDSLLGFERSLRTVILWDKNDNAVATASVRSEFLFDPEESRVSAQMLAASHLGKETISRGYVDAISNEPMVTVTVPAVSALGDFEGTLSAEVNLKFMWDLMDQLKVGSTGTAYVVDREGVLLAFRDPSLVLKRQNVGELSPVREFVSGKQGARLPHVSGYVGIAGVQVLGTYVPLGTPDWAVVAELPLSEAYAAVARHILFLIAIYAGTTAAAAIVGTYMARRLTIPLSQLTSVALRIAGGDLTLNVPSAGPREIAELAVAFNSMTRKLRQTLEGLERTITERTQELKDALGFQEEVFRASSTGIVVYAANGECIMANDAAARIIGATTSELLRENYNDLAIWREHGLYQSAQAAITSGQEGELEVHLVTSHGREAWMSLRFIPFSAGGQKNLLLTIIDVEETVRTEREISSLNRQLQERAESLAFANKELEAFSYSVSHDLRAPLRAIGSYARILLEDHAPQMNEEARRMCALIGAQTSYMAQLIDDLLALSRLGRHELRLTTIDMGALVQSALDQVTTHEERLRISVSIDPLPATTGDPVLVRQVWTNLIANAVKFSSKKDAPFIEVTGRTVGNENVYSVRDNGVGFDMSYAHKLFRVFQRLHTDREFEGTGIGLAIVQKAMNLHGGRVWAESKVGEGAVFSISFPTSPKETVES